MAVELAAVSTSNELAQAHSIAMTTPLEAKFKKAVWLVRNGPPKEGTSNDEKLKFYSLFKQATEGDCTAAQPWAVQVRGEAGEEEKQLFSVPGN